MILANGKRLESAMQDTVLDGLEERLNETLAKPAPTAETAQLNTSFRTPPFQLTFRFPPPISIAARARYAPIWQSS